jgi:hypothetical protein
MYADCGEDGEHSSLHHSYIRLGQRTGLERTWSRMNNATGHINAGGSIVVDL